MSRIGVIRCYNRAIIAVIPSWANSPYSAVYGHRFFAGASSKDIPPHNNTNQPNNSTISYSRRPLIRRQPTLEIKHTDLLPQPSTSANALPIPVPNDTSVSVQAKDADNQVSVHHMKLLTSEETPNSKTDNVIYFIAFASTIVFYGYMLATHEPELQSLIPDDFRKMTLQEVIPMTHDTILLRFQTVMPIAKRPPWDEKGIPVPSHVIIKDHTCEIARKYTPVTYATNHFDVVVKVYDDGSVSKFLQKQLPGDKVFIRGPLVSMPYQANMADEIGMVRRSHLIE